MSAASQELRFDSGRICLDLIATAGGRLGTEAAERIDRPQRLRDWLTASGLVPAGAGLDIDATWVRRFHVLRGLLHRIVHAELDGRAGAVGRDLERLDELCLAPPPAPQARRGHNGELRRTFAAEPDCAGLLSLVARDAVALLTDAESRGRLRECEGENCDLVYLDTSRGHRRRWCSSEVCGNRERVARHRRRTVAAGR